MSFLRKNYLLIYSFSLLSFLFSFAHLSAEDETRALKKTYAYWSQKFSQSQTPSQKTEILFGMIQEAVKESAQDEKMIYLLLANDGPRLCGGEKGDQAGFKRLLRSVIRESNFESLDDPIRVSVVQMISSLYQMEDDVLDEVFLFELRGLLKKGLSEWNWNNVDEETKKDFILNYNNMNRILGPEVSYHIRAKVIEMQKIKSTGKMAVVVEWELIEVKRIHNLKNDEIKTEESEIEKSQIEEFLEEEKAKMIDGDCGTKKGLPLEHGAAITLFRNLSKTANIRENPAPETDKIEVSNWERLVSPKLIPLETRTTTTGEVFTRDTSNPLLGEAWRDPDGLIWGDLVKNEDGTVRRMVQSSEYMKEVGRPLPGGTLGAKEYCESIGARLPSKEEFTRLREYMGARSETYEGYSAQVLPNLSGYWFWSSSVSPYVADDASGFYGSDGSIGYDYRYYSGAVRCVVGR